MMCESSSDKRPMKAKAETETLEIDLRELMGDRTQMVTWREDERYVLRQARQNKLILTK